MDDRLSKLLHDLIPTLQIDVPIMAARIVGGRLELTLYGGEQRSYPLPALSEVEAPVEPPHVAASHVAATAKKITKKSKKR